MAHPDLDDLLDPLIRFAQKSLKKHGEFHPFGASMKSDGEIALIAGMPAEGGGATQAIELLLRGLTADAKTETIRAGAVCYDGRVVPPGRSDKTNAISVSLEHNSGESVEVFLPYERGWFGRLKYGRLFAGPGGRRIFPDSQGADS